MQVPLSKMELMDGTIQDLLLVIRYLTGRKGVMGMLGNRSRRIVGTSLVISKVAVDMAEEGVEAEIHGINQWTVRGVKDLAGEEEDLIGMVELVDVKAEILMEVGGLVGEEEFWVDMGEEETEMMIIRIARVTLVGVGDLGEEEGAGIEIQLRSWVWGHWWPWMVSVLRLELERALHTCWVLCRNLMVL